MFDSAKITALAAQVHALATFNNHLLAYLIRNGSLTREDALHMIENASFGIKRLPGPATYPFIQDWEQMAADVSPGTA